MSVCGTRLLCFDCVTGTICESWTEIHSAFKKTKKLLSLLPIKPPRLHIYPGTNRIQSKNSITRVTLLIKYLIDSILPKSKELASIAIFFLFLDLCVVEQRFPSWQWSDLANVLSSCVIKTWVLLHSYRAKKGSIFWFDKCVYMGSLKRGVLVCLGGRGKRVERWNQEKSEIKFQLSCQINS